MRRALIVALVIFTSALAASAQTATPTPTPSPTGTLISYPVFPAFPTYAPTQLTPQVWGTFTPAPLGLPFVPPTFPASISIPEVGQQNGFGALGQTNVKTFAVWMVETGVSFWDWADTNTDNALDKFQLIFAITLLFFMAVLKFGKYRGGGLAGGLGMRIGNTVEKANRQSRKDKATAKAILLLPLLLIPGGDMRQGSCSDNQSCYGIPWSFPQFPVLLSPTPFPTSMITALYTSTATPTPGAGTPTAVPPTGTPGINVELISDQLGTLQAIAAATPFQYSAQLAPQNVSGSVSTVLGFIKGLQSFNLGIFQPFVDLIFFGFFSWLTIRFTFLILPVLSSFAGWLRRGVQILLDFLPL